MTDQQTDSRSTLADDEIALADIIAALNRRKNLVFGCVGAALLISLLYVVFTTPLYTASVTVQPATGEEGGLSGMANRLGGVAALAGVDLGGAGSTREEYLAILRSRELADRFIERYGLKPHLFPGRWNAEAGEWKPVDLGVIGGTIRGISSVLATLSGDEGWDETLKRIPTDWEAYQEFDEIRRVSEDPETGIVTVSFEFRDPELAAQWANNYVAMANEEIRQRTVEETSRALDYLNKQVQETTISGLRETIFGLVEGQLEQIMLANAREEYAFRVLDEAVVPEDRSHPNRVLIVTLSVVVGLITGVVLALAFEAFRGSEPHVSQ